MLDTACADLSGHDVAVVGENLIDARLNEEVNRLCDDADRLEIV
jgi:hypothetical protein